MFPQSSIKRLQFAFVVMAGLTLLALTVGCIAFVVSHTAQKRFVDETAPLLINIEQLSKVAVGLSSTSRRLETIDNQARLTRVLARYRVQSDALQQGLLDLADLGPQEQIVQNLHDIVRELDTHEAPYEDVLGIKINAKERLATLQHEIGEEGQLLLDRIAPLALEASLALIDAAQGPANDDRPDPGRLAVKLNEVQLLTDINFAVERLLHAVGRRDLGRSMSSALTSREAIAPEFRRLTQLVLKLRDREKREEIAASLPLFNEKGLGVGGVADQWRRLGEAGRQLERVNQQQTLLLTGMTDLIDQIVIDARERFFSGAEASQQSSFIAVSTLVVISTVAFLAVIWIGWRLINRDIAKRLERLATSTIALADGNLDVAIDQSGNDELANMARATEIFRRNARELHRTEAELAERFVEVERTNEKLVLVNGALDIANAGLAESELRYELAVNGSFVGIWDFDVVTKALFWSDRYKKMIGVTDGPDQRDFDAFRERLHPEDRDWVVESFQSHLISGDPYDVEYRHRHDDDGYVWIHARGQAIWDKDGNPTRMAGSIDDISDRKAAEIKLADYAEELERSNRELDQFAYIASHDLKEPLRAMYNHASFLLEDYQDKLGEDGEKRLTRMIKLSRRMEQLIADLLYFSRLGRGDQAMEQLDLNKVVAGIETDLAETLVSRNARIEIQAPLPPVSGHRAHITALFQNLISNGTKYNDTEEKVIEIGMVPAELSNGPVLRETVFVRDNGIGIEERFQDEVFRLFKRLNSEKAYGEGTGAGLTFVKKIVENHGGKIWLKSEPGKGTTFFFTLERVSGQRQEDEKADRAA